MTEEWRTLAVRIAEMSARVAQLEQENAELRAALSLQVGPRADHAPVTVVDIRRFDLGGVLRVDADQRQRMYHMIQKSQAVRVGEFTYRLTTENDK